MFDECFNGLKITDKKLKLYNRKKNNKKYHLLSRYA